MRLMVGDSFSSYKKLEDHINNLEIEEPLSLWRRDSHTIQQESLITLRGQRSIKGEPQIYGSFPNPRPRPLFLWVWFYGGLCKPGCVPILKLIAPPQPLQKYYREPQYIGELPYPKANPTFFYGWQSQAV